MKLCRHRKFGLTIAPGALRRVDHRLALFTTTPAAGAKANLFRWLSDNRMEADR